MHSASTSKGQQAIWDMERALAKAEEGVEAKKHLQEALGCYKRAIAHACNLSGDWSTRRLSDLIEEATHQQVGRRESAILAIRALSVDGFLPFEDEHLLERKVVELIEAGFQDQLRNLKLSEKRQTFEKALVLKGFHETICSNLLIFQELPSTLAEIGGIAADIQRALRHSLCNAYLQPFGWTGLKSSVAHACDQISELVACKDATYKARFDRLMESCRDLKKAACTSPSFLTRSYISNFALAVEHALQSIKAGAEDQFTCSVETRRRAPHVAEKRYTLHHENKLLTITIPMVNHGPGVAVDVVVKLDSDASNSLALDTEEIHLGDIPPGEFAVSFKAMVVKPATLIEMAMEVSWNQLFGDRIAISLDVQLTAQNPNVDWGQLDQLDPYSLEVAEGDKFVGRKAKVQAIGNRILKAQMSSTYITGQKRIGKTSLAQAVLSYVSAHATPPTTYATFYLEWGEYCAADASSTVKSLGEQVYTFLRSHLPPGMDLSTPTFDGSLAPLNSITKLLETSCPSKRFIVVLDEFDEIHPEMYRFGPLAEAFFANLRTLAARKNLAFILVGGEKMPFIIGAQGDQLNKFVREPLDYFSRSDEWNDYVELVTGPVRSSLNWEDSALNELFSVTNGHPYYTKLLCAKVFSTAVAQRDTEIIVSDVRHALNGRVSELDTNAFAHFWKDGINAERDEAEVIELKRLRVLVAFGRALRSGTANRATIAEHISTVLQPIEVTPLLEDFFRRDIMKEMDGDLTLQLPIFQRWIRDVGVDKLIASTLADDLESEIQKANDAAYVKSGEIESLVSHWPLYRGHEVTSESVRAWLDQVANPQEQRQLFTILENLKFVTLPQIGEMLRYAHDRIVAKATPPRVRETKVEKRRDLLVTYMDGPGKSGSAYARAYAKENSLLMECVVELGKAARRLAAEDSRPNAVIVVDDIAGTGRTIDESLSGLIAEIGAPLASHRIPLFLIVLFATEEAERTIQAALERFPDVPAQLHICEILTDDSRAFHTSGPGFWKDQQAHDRAKALCVRLAAGLYKEALGVGSQSLLIAFPETCPNNNLPIIFASRSGEKSWKALLPRPTS